MNPHQVTRDFEAELARYTGATYAVTVTSCTMALLLACAYYRYCSGPRTITIPRRTYVSVPQSIIHAGHDVDFHRQEWSGAYRLIGTGIVDSARRFTSGMHQHGDYQCVSFHASKILALEQGGAILHDNPHADAFFRRARFDGRTEGVDPKDDQFDMLGYHCYMSPSVAAAGLMKLSVLPKHNDDLPNSDYPDLSTFPIFGGSKEKANRTTVAA